MHKSIMLYNSDYTIVEQKTETTVDKKIPTTTQLPQKEVKTTNIETQSLKTETITKPENTINRIPKIQKTSCLWLCTKRYCFCCRQKYYK